MIPLPETSSPSTLRTRRVSACEPLCARLGAGVASMPDESCLPHTARDARIVAHSGGGDGQHRICLVCGEAAALPNTLGGAWPHTPKLRAEAHTHSKLRAFLRKRFYPPPAAQLQRGTSPPLRNPQLSEGTREIISERSSIMKKISNSARAWRPPTVRRSGRWRRRPTCP